MIADISSMQKLTFAILRRAWMADRLTVNHRKYGSDSVLSAAASRIAMSACRNRAGSNGSFTDMADNEGWCALWGVEFSASSSGLA